jgi:protease-4
MSRRLAVWIALLVVFIALVATAAGEAGGEAGGLSSPISRHGVTYSGNVVQNGDGDLRVAMIPIFNEIRDGDSPADGSATGGDDIVRMLDAITDDEDRWDGVILELDTPGGSVLASEEITEALARLHDETDIPVLAWMRGTAASAGYYISASSDRIVAAPTTFTGSIGVILEYFVAADLADEVGVKSVVIKSGKLKDIGNPLRNETPEERALLQAIIDEAYDEFVGVVSKGRDIDEADVRKLADGRIYSGKQAKDLDLVDVLGLRSTAYDEMAKLIDKGKDTGEDLDVVRFSRSFGFLESLAAGAQPSLDTVAAARAVRGALHGDAGSLGASAAAAGARPVGNGFATLEFRAELG